MIQLRWKVIPPPEAEDSRWFNGLIFIANTGYAVLQYREVEMITRVVGKEQYINEPEWSDWQDVEISDD